jgi:amidophosphoribosyltransferase
VARSPVNQLLYDGMAVLQHRGQDAAGIVTAEGHSFHMHKGRGLVRDVFRTRDMRNLVGHMGIAHCRYPTAGSASSEAEAQPFYVNSPFGITLAHNGNLVNSDELRQELFLADRRHVNTGSDSEILLNVLAHEVQDAVKDRQRLDPDLIFKAVAGVHRRVKGAYAVVAMIAGYGLLAFRDPHGIRPLIVGRADTEMGVEFLVASESVTLDTLGFKVMRDVAPGEAVFVDESGNFHSRQCADNPQLNPCIFEFVYLARPDSVIDGISVYEARRNMGKSLAEKIIKLGLREEIDVIIPIPDSSRSSALEVAAKLKRQYTEGFIKNRYIGRTFIMPGNALRKKSVRQKLNAMAIEFKDKNVLLVDDSIVRGTTSREIVQMARESGANKVFFASAAPPVRFPNVYGIDMPTRSELIATGRTEEEIAQLIGADRVIYQDLDALIEDVRILNPAITRFDCSCFDGVYVTGDVSAAYLASVEAARRDGETDSEPEQLGLNLV